MASVIAMPRTNTGGTKAPGGERTTAAVRALGGPRYLNKASGKMETGQQIKNFKPPKAPARMPAGKPPRAPSGAKPTSRQTPNYVEGPLNERQIQGLGKGYEQKSIAAQKAQYDPLLREVGQNELGASERYGQSSEASKNLLGSLAAQQEASAKTFENQAAENALQSAKSIETSGQQLGSQTPGYVAPELRAELNAEAQREVGAGAAGNTFAQNSAQASGNLLAAQRGAAALRATEGQGKITDFFQKQATGLQQKEAAGIPGIAAGRANYEAKIGAENEKAYATNQGLGIKNVLAQNTVAGTRSKIQNEAAKTRQAGEKLGLEGQKFNFSKWAKTHEIETKNLSAEDKARYDKAQVRIKEQAASGKAPSPAEGRKYMAKISELEAAVRQRLGPRAKGSAGWTHEAQEKVRKEISEAKGSSADQVSAAMNLAVYGRLGAADQAAAISYGLTPNLRPQWFKSK
jgi:hypothetical protein